MLRWGVVVVEVVVDRQVVNVMVGGLWGCREDVSAVRLWLRLRALVLVLALVLRLRLLQLLRTVCVLCVYRVQYSTALHICTAQQSRKHVRSRWLGIAQYNMYSPGLYRTAL